MTTYKRLPVGIEFFREITNGRYYYVDKTAFIRDMALNHDKVNLITRPRRFGKTLNMDMLKAFFEIGGDKTAFDGLEISRDKDFCGAYMGKYPVIFISLKGVEGLDFESAVRSFKYVIAEEAERIHRVITEKTSLSEKAEAVFSRIIQRNESGSYCMPPDVLERSLHGLTSALYEFYGIKPILLIDEYDVPLDKADQHGYYEEMVDLIRKLFGNALKTNDNLEFAVLTGCLRVSKESIFTGLNNFSVYSVTDSRMSGYFGFTDSEVREMLSYYSMTEEYDNVKEWYNGYRFGDEAIYCPWDVINYCSEYVGNREKNGGRISLYPKNYWINTSGNALIRKLIAGADDQTKEDIEKLIAGQTVEKEICETLTYDELDKDERSVWSLMLLTGYLTYTDVSGRIYTLRIPNLEVRSIFAEQVMEWFDDETGKEPERIEELCSAVESGDAVGFEKSFSDYLLDTIGIRDTNVRKSRKENFYHGVLLGLFGHRRNWIIRSNAEAGDGYSDILIINRRKSIGIIIELKYAESYGLMDSACADALAQIEDKRYDGAFSEERLGTVYKYGVVCCRKACRVTVK